MKFYFKLNIPKLIRKYIKKGPKGPFKINKLIKINFKIKREHLLPITISIFEFKFFKFLFKEFAVIFSFDNVSFSVSYA